MNRIRFIREYDWYGMKFYDIVYQDRTFTRSESELPKSAKNFLKTASSKEQYDMVFKRKEVIYEL